jgi:hypothetical protein
MSMSFSVVLLLADVTARCLFQFSYTTFFPFAGLFGTVYSPIYTLIFGKRRQVQ